MAEASIDRLTLDIVVNNDNATRRINAVTKAIEKLNTAMGKSSNIDKVLDKINNVSPTSTRGGSTSKGGSTKNKNVGIFATLGKWNYMINMTRYYGRQLANIVQLGMDYVETQNLWQVSNRNNIAQAAEFIDKMNKAYGISEATLMNYQALFKTMLSSLGELSDMLSSKLSQQLTQMALDFSSLYNVSIASAMTKFQAVLSGQVRPIRSVSGYDITENTIYDIYSKMGGEKSMRQLSQLEKRLLRIYAVFDQMDASGASGDLSKTINSASNQARIMSEQLKECLTWTGQIILSWLNGVGVFKYATAIFTTMSQVLKAIAYDTNAVPQDFFQGAFENVEGTNEAIDELQGKLLSFDRFEALNSKDGGMLGIDPIIEELISKIDVGIGNINNESKQISDRWLEQIGLGKEMYRVTKANGEVVTYTKEQYDALDEATKSTFTNVENYRAIGEEFRKIESYLKPIVTLMLVFTGMSVLTGLGKFLAMITNIKTTFSLTGTAIGLFVGGLIQILSSDFTPLEKLLVIVNALGVALAVAATAKHLFSTLTWGKALAIGGIIAGVGTSVGMTLANSVPKYATGGFPEDGLFFANSGEMVGRFSNGKTAVANNDQIVSGITEGVYSAMMAYNAQTKSNGISGDVILNGQKVGRIVAKGSHKEMVRAGYLK
jgi:hypothetical protein